MQINKLTKRQALGLAKNEASGITVTDNDFGWQYKVVTFDEMMQLLDEYTKHWTATQYEGSNTFSIDTRGRMHFEITLKPQAKETRSREMTWGGYITIFPRLRHGDNGRLLEPTHELIKVTTAKGYVYACASAIGEEPLTIEEALAVWYDEREKFQKYDESRGIFLK